MKDSAAEERGRKHEELTNPRQIDFVGIVHPIRARARFLCVNFEKSSNFIEFFCKIKKNF